MPFDSTVQFRDLSIDRRTINGDLRSARNSTMLRLIGSPRGNYGSDCRHPTNSRILSLIRTESVGPFRVTGLIPAIAVLKTVFAEIERDKPAVAADVGTAGMLCCRKVRGSSTAISNHSWGTAIDLTFGGGVDARGDNRVQKGLLEVYEYFIRHGFYWGAAFRTEDAMHFEASEQLIRKWSDEGQFGGVSGPAASSVLDFGDRGPEVEELQSRLSLKLGLDLDVDGIFGGDTRAAVMEFQRMAGLKVDGVVGQHTSNALMA
ncbi:peptidoglycan-binding protein [Mangrovicoccus sp. HB161399]|uniref:peptidoglycan-binding protein n=1 Tax=Mangrovicoccus sp. HB161399 TaxID=2720392 RepID=UPI00155362E2|nr:peptidoglycan-binding protein [Mangrovicoccus sp. HB161399]